MYRTVIKTGFMTLFVASITWFSVPVSAYTTGQDSHLTEQERHRIYEREQANRTYNQDHQLTEQERRRIYERQQANQNRNQSVQMTDLERRRAYERNRANQNSQHHYGQSPYYRHDSRWNKRCVYYKNHHRHVRNKRSCRR